MSRKFYILVDGEQRPVATAAEWSRWLQAHTEERFLACDVLSEDVEVATYFVGTGTPHDDLKHPNRHGLVWETVVRGGEHGEDGERSRTKDEALTTHRAVMARVRGEQPA